jgi:hypothetical protein
MLPGEELTISYIDVLEQSLLKRRLDLRFFDFLCACERCKRESHEGADSGQGDDGYGDGDGGKGDGKSWATVLLEEVAGGKAGIVNRLALSSTITNPARILGSGDKMVWAATGLCISCHPDEVDREQERWRQVLRWEV